MSVTSNSVTSNLAASRRTFLVRTAGLAATALLPGAARTQTSLPEIQLTAAPNRWSLVSDSKLTTDLWCYGARIPGPEIRLRQGESARIVVRNDLPEATTVHWHGIRLPNAMDGVPGLTQQPIKPGEQFTYEFTPPDAGTFWYHPHADSLQQLGRGLAGVLIVDGPQPVAVDRELTWALADWRLAPDGQIAGGFGNMMDAGMSGRLGNIVTVNGTVSNEETVRAGERLRLRLVNCSLARIMGLRFQGHHPVIVAIDGQPCVPHAPQDGRLLLGPAMRIDIVLDLQGEPGERHAVIDDFYDGLTYRLTQLAYDKRPPLRTKPLDAPLALPRNPLPEPDLANAIRHELTLQGGMMSGMGMMGGMGGKGTMGGMGSMSARDGAVWAINGQSMTGDGDADMPPLFVLERGRTCQLRLHNDTAWWHPIHIHGYSFLILQRNGSPVADRQWADTVLIPPKQTVDVAFVADNPGDWMLHCHVMDHQVSGMMAVLRVA
ncbi:MAG TPA: multicopper oxidase family protein [Xanthobacteraceae bacterium]|jgi:FtsP/CotA-like multicopper oxidase with cupredoxin domain|nr:multicopper oxidase family protein [Xanthobacteraceae bacterium]